MRRKPSASGENPTQSSRSGRKFDAERSIRALEERVTRLEKAFNNAVYPLEQAASEIQTEVQKRPGPKPVHFEGLIHDRDTLVQMLECFWPELEPLCRRPPKREGLRIVLEAISRRQAGRYAQASKHLADHIPELVNFLSGDRFRGDPRQIANAFAGFPKIGTWRSLKLCQSKPSNFCIGDRAIKAYIRRKHPGLYRELSADYSLPNFARALKTYRTQDQNLSPFRADYLYSSWKQCESDYKRIGVDLLGPLREGS